MPFCAPKIAAGGNKINEVSITDNRWHHNVCLRLERYYFFLSKLMDYGAKECKRHNLALENLKRARNKCNEDRMKRLDFINKRLREKN